MAAFAVGLLAGTSGLATAGALPDGAQEVAHKTLGAVGINVPHGGRYQGPECGGVVKNHGQYVRSQPKDKRAEAATSRCGKPINAGTGDDAADEKGGKGAECQGPPPWAGKGRPDPAAKAARKQACGDDDRDEKEEAPAPPAGGQPGASVAPETSATTGPAASTTSTSTATTATSSPTTATSAPTTETSATVTSPPATTPSITTPSAATPSTAGSDGGTTPTTAADSPASGQGS